jgi:hypothetical protein
MENGGRVYACLLDASKAFDRIRFDLLFQILISRKLPAVFIRLLMDSYRRQKLQSGWLGHMSDYFSVSNGVKQGGVASPIMFTLYMDVLLHRLEAEGIGCYIGHYFMGCLCYADDITLMAPTRNALQHMIDTCQKFAMEYDIIFNSKKTKCICFSQRIPSDLPPLRLSGDLLEWTSNVEHLGHYLTHNLNEVYEIQMKQNSFIKSVNSVVVNCVNLPRRIVSDVYLGQCHAFYGCQTWDMTSPHVQTFYVTWRKATRRVWGLPPQTRSAILPLMLRGLNFVDMVCLRILRLKHALDICSNQRLKYICGLHTSLITRNLSFICERYGSCDAISTSVELECIDRALVLDELVACRDGQMVLRGFSNDDLDSIIYFVACERH